MNARAHGGAAESAVERWARELRAWAVPEEILASTPESPYGFPTERFRSRGLQAVEHPASTPSAVRALEALPAGGGTVLDVGAGGGAASLPLAGRANELVGVDQSRPLLEAFTQAAAAAGVRSRAVAGTWPDIAPAAPIADVAVCHHVLYNVAQIEPFARALDAHARARVVTELTERHPLSWMNDLWERFHSLSRPTGPSATDAADALREMGLEPNVEDREVTEPHGGFARRADAIALVRRRLCLSHERDGEVAEALGDRLARRNGLWSAGPASQIVITLWWDPHTG